MSELHITSLSEPIAATSANNWSMRIGYPKGETEFRKVDHWIYLHGGKVFPGFVIDDEVVTSEALQARYSNELKFTLFWDGEGFPEYPEAMGCECHPESS